MTSKAFSAQRHTRHVSFACPSDCRLFRARGTFREWLWGLSSWTISARLRFLSQAASDVSSENAWDRSRRSIFTRVSLSKRSHDSGFTTRNSVLDRQRQSGEHAGIRRRRSEDRRSAAGDDRQDSGEVAYAVISFGGFLGMGEDYYPMPWASLQYDTNLGGYRVGVTEDQSKALPNILLSCPVVVRLRSEGWAISSRLLSRRLKIVWHPRYQP